VSAFDHVASIVPQQIWEGVSGRSVHAERVTFGVIEFEPHAAVPEHSHHNEQVGLLLEGTVRFRIGDETRELERGAMWRIPAHVPHAADAGRDGAVIAEVFSPPRDDWAELETRPGAGSWR
jgi:quercetin dioxygenase-like cupin family protein